MSRSKNIQTAKNEVFDLVVIGGGITGAGIALKSAQKKWKTLIIDKHDFAYGTSSRSAKMIHGGLRYLEQMQVKLVKEALREREHLLNSYPHLVVPQPFFMPIYHSKFDKIKIGIGLSGYDFLSGESSLPKHTQISVEEISQKFPQIKTENIIGGFLYYDAKTNDARLTIDTIQDAQNLGAVALNYFELQHFKKSGNIIKSIICKDKITGEEIEIKSKFLISATGIWTDELLKNFNPEDSKKYMAPSKGTHIVVSAKHFPEDCVMLFPTANGDGRMIWAMPWSENLNIIGTTDTDYKNGNDEIVVTEDEVKYILQSVNAQLKKPISEDDILSVFAGVRPLINDNNEDKKSNKRSRDYQIWWNNDNLITISGGKFTSFLSMAENCIKSIDEKMKISESEKISVIDEFKEKYGLKNASVIAEIISENINYKNKIGIYNYTFAELLFFIRHQNAMKLDDFFTRRTLISYQMKDYDESVVMQVAEIFTHELHWNDEKKSAEIKEYYYFWKLMHTWK